MKQRSFQLLFSLTLASLFLLPAGMRCIHMITPGTSLPVSVKPLPDFQIENIKNGQGMKGKIKGAYMDMPGVLRQFDDWYRTGFTFREELLGIYQGIKTDLLNTQVYPDQVLAGRDDWLFTGDNFDGSFSELLGLRRMTDPEIKELADIIENLQAWCERRGIVYVFMPVRGKAGFYQDKILYYKSDLPTTLGLLVNELKGRGLRVVDSRAELEKYRDKQLYFKQDSHWNGHGAWIAYNLLMDTLQQHIPGLYRLSKNDVFADTTYPGDNDLARLINRKSPYPSVYVKPKRPTAVRIENRLTVPDDYVYVAKSNYEFRFRNDSAKFKSLVYRDSYFVHLEPLFIQSFNESVEIWHRIPDTTLIKNEHPDVVLQEISERIINDFYEEYKTIHGL